MGPVTAAAALWTAVVVAVAVWVAVREQRMREVSARLRTNTLRWWRRRLPPPWWTRLRWLCRLRATPLAMASLGVIVECLLVAVFAAVQDDVLDGDGITVVDQPVSRWLAEHRERGLTAAMHGLTRLGDPGVLVVIATVFGAILAWRGRTTLPLLLSWLTMGGLGLTVVITKLVVGRPRPTLGHAVRAGGFSFPSGHATGVTAVAVVCGWMLCRWWIHAWRARTAVWTIVVIVVGGVGFSRVYLGVHYLSDILAGWILGLAWAGVVIMTARARPGPRNSDGLGTAGPPSGTTRRTR